jgi:hypothetical protein
MIEIVPSGEEHQGETQPRLQVRRLTQVEPLLPSLPHVLYEYSVPDLAPKARRALGYSSAGESAGTYTGYRDGPDARPRVRTDEARILEAAVLIARLYTHVIDPHRFEGGVAPVPDRTAIFDEFARALMGERFLPAVELVARGIGKLRLLDNLQPNLGTNTARWMQYLAFEASRTEVVRDGDALVRELSRLRTALLTIRDSATAMDRFRVLSRDGH